MRRKRIYGSFNNLFFEVKKRNFGEAVAPVSPNFTDGESGKNTR